MTANVKLSEGFVDLLFGSSHCKYDLVGGKISGVTERVIYLTSDLVKGIYEALLYEAGDAWGLIFKNCGHIWGKREIDRINKETLTRMRKELAELTVGEFVDLVENYFSRQGWGKVTVHLDDADQYGIVRVSVSNSLFDANLAEVKGPVNYMIVGIVLAFFEHISQAKLDCVELAWHRSEQHSNSDLLISGQGRIEKLTVNSNYQSLNLDEALGILRVA